MLRKLQTAMAMIMVLAMAACNSVTGPVVEEENNDSSSGYNNRPQDQFDAPDQIVEDDEGGGGGAEQPPQSFPGARDRERNEWVDEDWGGQGGGMDHGEILEEEDDYDYEGGDVTEEDPFSRR